jgi:predicted nucleic acid-binding protein
MKDKSKTFIDTNILLYSIYGSASQQEQINVFLKNQSTSSIISTQVLKEFTNVCLKKKLNKTTAELKQHLSQFKQVFTIVEITLKNILIAIKISAQYKFSFYDSLIIATALENKCNILLSEDLQHNQIIKKKLKIINPFQ